METIKSRYKSPEIEDLKVNAFAVIAGTSAKIDQVDGDVDETETLD